MKRPVRALLMLLLTSAVLAAPAQAQFWEDVKDAAKDAAKRAVIREVEDRTIRVVRSGFDLAENAVKCVITDETCIERAKQEGKDVVLTNEGGGVYVDKEGRPISDPDAIPAEMRPGAAPAEVNANYDFKPGERTIFAENFESDNVGDFPRSLEFREGSMAIVEWQGGRSLRAKTTGAFDIHLPEKLPQRFTLEFEAYTVDLVNGMAVHIVDAEGESVGANYIKVDSYEGTGIASYERGGISSLQGMEVLETRMIPIRVMADGTYVKVYVGTTRVANVPNADLGRTRTLRFDFYDVREEPIYIANIRIAAGGRDLYEALEAEGRVAVRDILFATGSATIQPASEDVLTKIGTMLTEHPDLQLLIEGHTDNEGGFEMNMDLSKERAEAVKAYLVEKHGIEASRLRALGLGSTQPVDDNDTPEGRRQNRRVELVRL